MKIRFALFALLLSLAMFAAVLLRPKHNPVQKPNPATAIVDSTGAAMPVWDSNPNSTDSMDLVYTIPKGEHNNGWCSDDMQSWWPARADSVCYAEDKKNGTCLSPSLSEPWCNDGTVGDGGQEIKQQERRTN
jgi:hypothetical protein